MTSLAEIQSHVGVEPDGVWGPITAAAIAKALGIERKRHDLADPAAFFAAVREITGPLDQLQVDSINGILDAAAHWPLPWVAYGLATAWHEARFKPQREWGKGGNLPYARPGRYGQPQYGRGLIQLTWDDNYQWADRALGLNGSLIGNFDRALEPKIATAILVKGMEEGAFNPKGKGIAFYVGRYGMAPKSEFVAARTLVNLNDKASMIADYAVKFQDALDEGDWR